MNFELAQNIFENLKLGAKSIKRQIATAIKKANTGSYSTNVSKTRYEADIKTHNKNIDLIFIGILPRQPDTQIA